MFNTMTLTKAAGGVLTAFLILLLGNWVASSLYSTAPGGHGEEQHVAEDGGAAHEEPAAEPAADPAAEPAADRVDQAADEPTGEPAAEEEPVAVAMAGDPAAGEAVFKKCKSCHKLEEGANAVGPDLFGIVGREVASREGFKYSDAMLGFGGVWDAERLAAFLLKPKDLIPGTKMTFSGLRKEEDRADLIAYLATIK